MGLDIAEDGQVVSTTLRVYLSIYLVSLCSLQRTMCAIDTECFPWNRFNISDKSRLDKVVYIESTILWMRIFISNVLVFDV